MKQHYARRSNRLAFWIVLASVATIVLAAYAREHWREPGSMYMAVRAQSARPLSVRLSVQPAAPAALPGFGAELCAPAVCRVEGGETALAPSLPRPASLRHEYPRGPPRA